MTKDYPILFSGPMVRAILEGRKTQTRRVMKPQPSSDFLPSVGFYNPTLIDRDGEAFPGPERFGASDENEGYPCPYGKPGSRLWVKETWAQDADGEIFYAADYEKWKPSTIERWKPSIFMSQAASRLTLEITNVRIERLNNITEEDAQAEGIFYNHHSIWGWSEDQGIGGRNAKEAYCVLWNAINASRGFGWDTNPWVWVIEFRRVQ